jgi:hypothetical protein
MRSQSRVHDRQAARDGRDFVLLSRGGGTIREWRLEEGRTALAGEVVLAYTGDLAENEIAPITASLVRVLATPGMSVRSGDVLGIMRRLARKS